MFDAWVFVANYIYKGHFPLGGIFHEERHLLLFKDRLAESGRQKTKENIIPRGKFRQVENSPKDRKIRSNKKIDIKNRHFVHDNIQIGKVQALL